MRRRVSECAQSLTGRLKGDGDQSISIVITRPTEETRVAPTNIAIMPADFRSHSLAYSSSIDCPTIAHELLHLLGLADEYSENDLSLGNMACRSPGLSNSLMTNQYQAFHDDQGYLGLRYTYCSCRNSKECAGISDHRSCTAGGFQVLTGRTELATFEVEGPKGDLHSYLQGRMSGGTSIGGMPLPFKKILAVGELGSNRREKNSLLFPAQFRLITAPFCGSRNQRYNECTRNTYLSTRIEIAGMMLQGGDCPVLPDYCHNGDWLQ